MSGNRPWFDMSQLRATSNVITRVVQVRKFMADEPVIDFIGAGDANIDFLIDGVARLEIASEKLARTMDCVLNAGFLSKFLTGEDLKGCARAGVVACSRSVSRRGGTAALQKR